MFKAITLEVSLKPFKRTDEESIRSVCKQIFDQWTPLIKNRSVISILLWTADGSEILDYTGDLSASFEWCYWQGTANHKDLPEGVPTETSLHVYRHRYLADPPVMTYAILRTIVSCLREEGKRRFPSATIRIGETFDIGPEFSVSDFKYRRHPEVCHEINHFDPLLFVDATSLLHADTYPYAAYPDGVPEGTPFGTLLGKQAQIFLPAMGFDYLWLSNGLGFSADPWSKTGKIFDGERYYPERLKAQKEKVFLFWKLFRAECDLPLEVRGTNNSVGIDYASDGVPLHDIYSANLDITAPPNSPWAAINENYGLELMGHMSRICELPGKEFPFRFYLHDPWWINSPWYDRYNGVPCDIYLPMAISRLTADGRVECANTLNLLTVDNSFGDMPDSCVYEPLPHLLRAEKDCADAPAPLVWIYPLREYTTAEGADLLREMNLGDHFICDAINDGLPLCCVSSTDAFLQQDSSLYRHSTLISPIPTRKEVLNRLLALAKTGIGVILYGTKEALATIPENSNLLRCDSEGDPAQLRFAWEQFGYGVRFEKKVECRSPILTLHRQKNGFWLSVFNGNTTTETTLRFPHGAPILDCGEAEIKDGFAAYRFPRFAHRECRVFVEQQNGVVSLKERNPTNKRYRRKALLSGLENATVRFFPETDCEAVAVSEGLYDPDGRLRVDPRFTLVRDPLLGDHLLGKNISGSIFLMMGYPGTM